MFEDAWECTECGATYRRRPRRCRDCESTVFDPLDLPASPSDATPDRPAGDADDPRWVCERCGRVHEFRPSVCVACGTNDVAYRGPADERVDVSPGFPASPDAVRREAAAREIDDPVDPRELAFVVLVCTVFVVLLVLYTVGVL